MFHRNILNRMHSGMDKASLTIDRHTPQIPSSLYLGVHPREERCFTILKNRVILPGCEVNEITRWQTVPGNRRSKEPRKIITESMLAEAEQVAREFTGLLHWAEESYLESRQISLEDAYGYNICSLRVLLEHLSPVTAAALSLTIPDRFESDFNRFHTGISIPFWHQGVFFGFCTRVMDNPIYKYLFSVPNRYCFGVSYYSPEIYMVEGVFDAIRMHQFGYNCMALGDSQPNYYKLSVADQFQHINLLFDNDYSGLLGAVKAHILLTRLFDRDPETISILQLEGGKDIGEVSSLKYRKHTIEQAISVLDQLGATINPEDYRVAI